MRKKTTKNKSKKDSEFAQIAAFVKQIHDKMRIIVQKIEKQRVIDLEKRIARLEKLVFAKLG